MTRELILLDQQAPVRRSNPDAGDAVEMAKRGLVVGVGYGGASWLSTLFPRFVKSNGIIDGLATLATAFLPMQFRQHIPGGSEIASDLAAGMAAAGAVKLVKPLVSGVPGSKWLPNSGGGSDSRRMPAPVRAPLPAPAVPRPASVTAIRAPLGIS